MDKSDPSQIPTLARLSFWIPPERIAEFEAHYTEKVVPILTQHGLKSSSEQGRSVVEGVFCRLFEMKTPSEVEEKQEALQQDSIWQEVLRDLEAVFATGGPGSLIQHSFELYAAPVGSGTVVSAGFRKGLWDIFDVTDGLADSYVRSILQDREGHLWFGTDSGGVSRYDGQTFTKWLSMSFMAY